MWLGILVLLGVGLTLLSIGVKVYQGNISLIHSYHHRNVKDEDKLPYAHAMGIGLMVISLGCFLSAILAILGSRGETLVPIIVGLVMGLVVIHKAQMVFNGGWL